MAAEKLEFVRTYDVNLIPRKLLENVKGFEGKDIDRFYQIGPLLFRNPLSFLYVMTDGNHKIRGCLWANVNIFEAVWYVQLLSIDKKYQGMGNVERVRNFLFSIKTGPELKKIIRFATDRPEPYKRQGAKKYKVILELGEKDVDTESSKSDRT